MIEEWYSFAIELSYKPRNVGQARELPIDMIYHLDYTWIKEQKEQNRREDAILQHR